MIPDLYKTLETLKVICVLCKKNDVRPPWCCDKCGRLVCKDCRRKTTPDEVEWWVDSLGHRKAEICKFCIAEKELST